MAKIKKKELGERLRLEIADVKRSRGERNGRHLYRRGRRKLPFVFYTRQKCRFSPRR